MVSVGDSGLALNKYRCEFVNLNCIFAFCSLCHVYYIETAKYLTYTYRTHRVSQPLKMQA